MTRCRATAPTYRVVAIPGDGIGPEVIAAGRRVLDAVGAAMGFAFDWHELVVGGRAIDDYGVPIRDEDLAVCAAADAVYLGAIGGPKWDDPSAAVRPEQALFALRGGLGLYANLRPVTVEPALMTASPLRPTLLRGVDLLIVRELTGGLYFGRPSEERATPDGRVGGRYPALHRGRDPARRAPGVRAGAGSPGPVDERRQGQRPGHLAPLAQGRRRAAPGVPDRHGRASPRRLVRPCCSSSTRPPSTSS